MSPSYHWTTAGPERYLVGSRQWLPDRRTPPSPLASICRGACTCAMVGPGPFTRRVRCQTEQRGRAHKYSDTWWYGGRQPRTISENYHRIFAAKPLMVPALLLFALLRSHCFLLLSHFAGPVADATPSLPPSSSATAERAPARVDSSLLWLSAVASATRSGELMSSTVAACGHTPETGLPDAIPVAGTNLESSLQASPWPEPRNSPAH